MEMCIRDRYEIACKEKGSMIMPKGTNQKLKLYRLAQIMLEQTDDEHYITMAEIMEALRRYDITADRKSPVSYTHLHCLQLFFIFLIPLCKVLRLTHTVCSLICLLYTSRLPIPCG